MSSSRERATTTLGGTERLYERGACLFEQGSELAAAIRIETGTVKLVVTDGAGHASIVALSTPGQWLGISSVLVGLSTPVSAECCSEVRATLVPASTFRRRLQEDAEWSFEFHRQQAFELSRQQHWIGQLGSSSRLRLRRIIRELAASIGHASPSGLRIALPLQQWELAQLLAMTPEHLNRLLRDLELQGLIRRDRGWLVVPDIQQLCGNSEYSGDPALSPIGHGAPLVEA